jgi:hypothetical protein
MTTINSSKEPLSATTITSSDSTIGSFGTAPDHLVSNSVSTNTIISFDIGGNLGGQNYCRLTS